MIHCRHHQATMKAELAASFFSLPDGCTSLPSSRRRRLGSESGSTQVAALTADASGLVEAGLGKSALVA